MFTTFISKRLLTKIFCAFSRKHDFRCHIVFLTCARARTHNHDLFIHYSVEYLVHKIQRTIKLLPPQRFNTVLLMYRIRGTHISHCDTSLMFLQCGVQRSIGKRPQNLKQHYGHSIWSCFFKRKDKN